MVAGDNQTIPAEYLGVVRDAASYFSILKDMGISNLRLSKESMEYMEDWGQSFPVMPGRRMTGHPGLSGIEEVDPGLEKDRSNLQKPSVPDSWTKANGDKNRLFPSVLLSEGDPTARLFLVSSHGKNVEKSPFGGEEGALLMKILGAINLSADDVFFSSLQAFYPADVLKHKAVLEKAGVIINRQIRLVSPKIICILGEGAVQFILKEKERVRDLRGRFLDFQGIPVMATHHPADLFRDAALKRPVWEDMKMVMAALGDSHAH